MEEGETPAEVVLSYDGLLDRDNDIKNKFSAMAIESYNDTTPEAVDSETPVGTYATKVAAGDEVPGLIADKYTLILKDGVYGYGTSRGGRHGVRGERRQS